MKTRVLDSWPILEWMMSRDPGRKHLDRLIAEAGHGQGQLFISAINAGEVYYILRKTHSSALADSWRASSLTFPATIVVPTLADIWEAAVLKSRHRIAYADAFAAALAQKYRCPVVTGDPEFHAITGLQIEWISPPRP